MDAAKDIAYSSSNPADVFGAILLTGLLIPLAEEILDRGFLLSLLRERIGNLWLVGLLGVIVFAVPHLPRLGLGGTLFIFLWASLPVALFLTRRSIYASYTTHVINNLFAYVVVPIFFQ